MSNLIEYLMGRLFSYLFADYLIQPPVYVLESSSSSESITELELRRNISYPITERSTDGDSWVFLDSNDL